MVYTIDYKIVDNCDQLVIAGKKYKHPAPDKIIDDMPPKYKKIHQQLKGSKHCLINVMLFLDGENLQSYLNRVAPKYTISSPMKWQYLNQFIDLLEQLKFLHVNGYAHNDIHNGNIMILKSGRATLIDYGIVDSKKWNKKWSPLNDYYNMFYITRKMNHFDEFIRLNKKYGDTKCPIGHKYYLQDLKKFMKTPESEQIMELCKHVPIEQRQHCAFDLAEMLMPEFMKTLQLPKLAAEANFKELWLIDFEHVLFYLNNVYTKGIDVVIKYFKKQAL
jgi:serine/threonine protein kinase